jgi:hypothetical protein
MRSVGHWLGNSVGLSLDFGEDGGELRPMTRLARRTMMEIYLPVPHDLAASSPHQQLPNLLLFPLTIVSADVSDRTELRTTSGVGA